MGRQPKDITGQRFGKLVVIKNVGKEGNYYLWLCKCDCGNKKNIRGAHLKSGNTKSCGCLKDTAFDDHLKKAHINLNENLLKEGTMLSTLFKKKGKNNTSGITGVYWNKNKGKWNARITFKGKCISLGDFRNKQDAINARKEAEEKYFKPILEKYGKSEESE